MNDKMPTAAIIEHNSSAKYVLGVVRGKEEQKLVVVSMRYELHKDIASAYSRRLGSEQTFRPLGGGYLTMNTEEKKIETHGESGSYGRPDLTLVQRVLKENYPEYTIDLH